MPDVKNSKNSKCLVKIYNEKIKKDIYKLLSLKKNKKSNNELYKIKQKMLEENHKILSKCLGKLPLVFNYEYMDKNNKYSKLKDITPLEFLNKYLTIELDDLIGIANVPMYNKDYYKLYRKQFSENIYEKDYVDFINMPIEVLKELSIKHLKDGIPVYFGCNMTKMKNADIGIMDSNLYNYKDVFDIDILTKEEALSMYDISFEHVMLITGVHIEDNKIIRWKVEDSYGETTHQDGYYIMNDNFFDDYVIEVIIDKKYLSKEQLELLKQEVTYIDMNDPF